MAGGPDNGAITSMALRHTFVSMLFALVIAETAVQISILAATGASAWEYGWALTSLETSPTQENWLILAAPGAHLLLGFILISTSWVGWSKSIQRADSRDIEDIFSIPFALLLIELLLVILYFVLVRSVGLGDEGLSYKGNLLHGVSISVSPEAFWLMAVYIGYAVWDGLSDALPKHIPKDMRPFRDLPFVSSFLVFTSGLSTRCLVSLLCALAAWYVHHRSTAIVSTPLSTIWGDMALVCIVFWFWLAKIWEQTMENVFPWERNRKGRRKDTRGWRAIMSVFLIPVFVICIMFMNQNAG